MKFDFGKPKNNAFDLFNNKKRKSKKGAKKSKKDIFGF